jgi:hypothetical protein
MWFESVAVFSFRLVNPQKIVTLIAPDAYAKAKWMQKIRTGIDSSKLMREQVLRGTWRGCWCGENSRGVVCERFLERN